MALSLSLQSPERRAARTARDVRPEVLGAWLISWRSQTRARETPARQCSSLECARAAVSLDAKEGRRAKLETKRGSSGKRQGGLEVPPPQCVAASHWLPPGVSVLRRRPVSFRTTAVVFLRRRRSSSLPSVITWSFCIAP